MFILFQNIINLQKEKEDKKDIWENSPFKYLIKLQCNNVGIVGEQFIQKLCDISNIKANIEGSKLRLYKIDGYIKSKSVEIKTSHQGSSNFTFQHELAEEPWISEYIIFVDVSPYCIYITIFKNFDKKVYLNIPYKQKCTPYFPTKTITRRKNSGSFKLDTSVKINEMNIIRGYTIKITEDININQVQTFINKQFN